jgi:peptidyl-prolyl cis-trans isomerase D
MLKMMRHKFFTFGILSVIVFIITIAFIFSGVWTPGDNVRAEIVAQVGEQEIPLKVFRRVYDNEFDRMREQYPDEKDIEEKFNIKGRVLNSLIDQYVLLAVAEEAGIDATEVEIQKVIISNPYFQRNGVFDEKVYDRFFKVRRISKRDYEAGLRDSIILTKMSRMIGETAELSSNELQILDSLEGGNQEQLHQVFMSTKRNQAISAYIEGIKRRLDVKVSENFYL